MIRLKCNARISVIRRMHNVHVLLEGAILATVAANFVGFVLAIFVAIALINAVDAQAIATLELVRGAGSC